MRWNSQVAPVGVHQVLRFLREAQARRDARPPTKTVERNQGITRRTDRFPSLLDFYNTYDPLDVLSIGLGAAAAYWIVRTIERGDSR